MPRSYEDGTARTKAAAPVHANVGNYKQSEGQTLLVHSNQTESVWSRMHSDGSRSLPSSRCCNGIDSEY